MTTPEVALFIEPQTHHFLGDRLFAEETAKYGGDSVLAPFLALRDYFESRGIPIHTADFLADSDARRKIYVSLGMRGGYRSLLGRDDVVFSAFFALECPVVEPALYRAMPELQKVYKRLYSWTDSDTLYPLAKAPLTLHRLYWPQSFDHVHEELWLRQDRRFLVMINANKLPALRWHELYTERVRALAYFGEFGEIDLYGKGWDEGVPYRLSYGLLPGTVQRALRSAEKLWRKVAPDPFMAAAQRAWKGVADSKSETLSNYRFAICFENAALRGWMTEKIFDCFFAGVIPVYLGASDITDHVPAEAFIDMRDFSGYDELRKFLKSLGGAEIDRYRQSARAFLDSAAFDPFRKQSFVNVFRQIVEDDAGIILPD